MNICIVTPAYKTARLVDSGIGNHFSDLAHGLSDLGHNVHVLYVTESVEESNDDIEGPVKVHVLKVMLPTYLHAALKSRWAVCQLLTKIYAMLLTRSMLARLVREHSIDVIETTSYSSLCLTYLFKSRRPPIITRVSTTLHQLVTEHHQFSSRSLKILAWLERQFVCRSDHLVTHTSSHRDTVCQEFRLAPCRFNIIRHGISVPEAPTYDSSGKEWLTVLYVGRFEYRKGTDILMKAIPKVLRQFDNVRFLLVGNDPGNSTQKEFLAEWADEYGPRAQFLGRVDQETLNRLYADCDVFVAPSRYESFGLIYAEVMSYGKPVIGCRTGGVPEVVEDGVSGILTEPGSVDELAEGIIKLVSDEPLRRLMGLKGRERVKQVFAKEVMCQLTARQYEIIVNRPGRMKHRHHKSQQELPVRDLSRCTPRSDTRT